MSLSSDFALFYASIYLFLLLYFSFKLFYFSEVCYFLISQHIHRSIDFVKLFNFNQMNNLSEDREFALQ